MAADGTVDDNDPETADILERLQDAVAAARDQLGQDDAEDEYAAAKALLVAMRNEGLEVFVDDATD